MPRLCRCLCAAIALALFVLSTNGTPALAAEPGSLIVIVDGSGSMWGPIEGVRQTKLVLAREALRRGLGKMAPQARVGLALFGHRRGDCSDVEVVRPPEPLDVPNLMSPLEQFNPRGRGPLTLALREAAKSLPRDAGPRTLLLIHDDADNCQPDLCAAAAELKTAGITAHVVGLNVKTEDMAKMVCLPQTTGGRHFNAQNAEQVAAYVEEALLLTASEMGGIETRPASPPATAIVPPSPLPASGPPALHLRALAAANTEPLGMPLHWTVTAEARPDVPIFGARAANPTVPVTPGRYIVEARDGPALGQADGRSPRQPTCNRHDGAERRHGAYPRARPARPARCWPDALITVTDANGALMLASRTGETTALLPAGRHVVRAELGLVRAEQTVTITAGRLVCRRHVAQRRAAATDDGRRAASSRLQRVRRRPGRTGRQARGRALSGPACRVRVAARDLLRRCATRGRGGARTAGGRPGRCGATDVGRRGGQSRAFDQAARIGRRERTPTSPIR